MVIPSSQEWRQIFHHARDVASKLGQSLSSVHVLLSIFIVPNKAEHFLLEHKINEDRILERIDTLTDEPSRVLEEIHRRSQEAAERCGSEELDSLHLLIALTRVRVGHAYDILERCAISLSTLRGQVMAYLTGRVKRKFPTLDAGMVGIQINGEEWQDLPNSHAEERTSFVPENESRSLEAGELDPEIFPQLTRLGKNLTQRALAGLLDPVIGREHELEEMIDILGKRRANNPCLVGEPGVGKTALVEGLAVLLAQKTIPGLSGKIIIELDIGSLLAGTQLRGSLTERLKGIKDEVRSANGQIIIFIDEIHTLVRAGATGEGAQDAANDLKTALGRGEFPCIGATTMQDYKNYIERDPALVRRFHTIWVEEPNEEEAHYIVERIVPHYAAHHGVHYEADALHSAVRLSARFIHNRRLPAKAIDLIDLAGAKARRSGANVVTVEQVAQAVAHTTGVSEEHLFMEESKRLLLMEDILSQQIIGHRRVIKLLSTVLRRNYAGFNGTRPFGSFLFLGPPGVGKTETAKAVAQYLFGHGQAILRFDMSEYQDSSSVTRLIGAPPGYVGHDEGGQLTEAIRTKPYQMILLDEIEKAHRDVLMLLLQILDEGVLTDGKGRRVSFSQTVIIMTSNQGSEAYTEKGRAPIGFSRGPESDEMIRNRILEAAQQQFPPELWNRINEQLVFTPLQLEEVRQIARLLIDSSSRRLQKEKDITYSVQDDVLDWLIDKGGYHPRSGVRPMRAMIERYLEASLANLILEGCLESGTRWEACLDEDRELTWILRHDSVLPEDEVSSNPPESDYDAKSADIISEPMDDDELLDPLVTPLKPHR